MSKAIIGLGNPGNKFQNTPHNLGFAVVDFFRQEEDFPKLKIDPRSYALLSQGKLEEEKVWLMKPRTFMNHSGQAVKNIKQNFELTTQDLWVVHDDFDLPFGRLKIVRKGSAAGHKGVQSIIDEIGTKEFIRFRLGVGDSHIENLKQYVLTKFNSSQKKATRKMIQQTYQSIKTALQKGIEQAMEQYN